MPTRWTARNTCCTSTAGSSVAHGIRRPGSLGVTADPFQDELTDFVTYDTELADAATEIGLPVRSPARPGVMLEG
jgi:hypothetical protein